MEPELDPRLKSLPFKVRATSRESQSQKASHVLDTDLRTHWSTATNTKEWIVLELDESCLLSHIRIHNKSVLEWEISVGLKFKPDNFLKVRPRCEAPRREIMYHIGYIPCRFVRISCLRGNPIAIFYVQLIGITVPGLEPEFQSVVDHLLPHIISQKQEANMIYLQLLQDITSRLCPFIPQLEAELSAAGDTMESSVRFLAMLAGPFYPILNIIGGRDNEKTTVSADSESLKFNQASVFTISSNFQAPPKRARSPCASQQATGHVLAFRPDVVLLLLKIAYKDGHLGAACGKVSKILHKLGGTFPSSETSVSGHDLPVGSLVVTGVEDPSTNVDLASPLSTINDFSSIFGEEFKISDDITSEVGHIGASLDIPLVEEALLHVLYASVSQPMLCRRLAEPKSDLVHVLPFIQAILPALRPSVSGSDLVDENFWQWQTPLIHRSLSQVVVLSTSSAYRPLLDACTPYLTSYSAAHERAACILVDLCAGPLSPWLPMVIAKVDLAIELVEDLLGIIQAGHRTASNSQARAALIYIMLALSGHMDDYLVHYKEVKHNLLFLIEMLEPFLVPAITPLENTIAFGDLSPLVSEKQDQLCTLALDLLHTAAKRPAVLPAMEAEWKKGQVAPSVLLSILAPQLALPPGIDFRKNRDDKKFNSNATSGTSDLNTSKLSVSNDSENGKSDTFLDGCTKADENEDPSCLFVPPELKGILLSNVSSSTDNSILDGQGFVQQSNKLETKYVERKENEGGSLLLGMASVEQHLSLEADFLQLLNAPERELHASDFIRFAVDLHTQMDTSVESGQAAIDALLLAAECHLNPFFMVSHVEHQLWLDKVVEVKKGASSDMRLENHGTVNRLRQLEEQRDKAVLRILIQAAEWDSRSMIGSDGHVANDDGFFERLPLAAEDAEAEDSTTLVRQHQVLLCRFLVRQLQREMHNMYDVLLQGLLFVLESATHLCVPPQDIIDVILKSAARLNSFIISSNAQVKEGEGLSIGKTYGVRRLWVLLVRLVSVVAGGGSFDVNEDSSFTTRTLIEELVPVGVWLDKIPKFAFSPLPLVRYVGWMALARYATLYKSIGSFLVTDIRQLTNILLVFRDELISSTIYSQKSAGNAPALESLKINIDIERSQDSSIEVPINQGNLINALYPELDSIFPEFRSQFNKFAEIMLEAVCLQMRAVVPGAVPDLLTWFCELCQDPFPQVAKGLPTESTRFEVRHSRHIIMRLLQVILLEHMEAIVPEIPRIIQILLQLCDSSYCDVSMLDSVLRLLKPIISHAAKVVTAEFEVEGYISSGFESLCFVTMMDKLKAGPESNAGLAYGGSQGALLLFVVGSLLPDLPATKQADLVSAMISWVKFTEGQNTGSYFAYLCAFHRLLDSCSTLLEANMDESELQRFKGLVGSHIVHDSSLRSQASSDISNVTYIENGKAVDEAESEFVDVQKDVDSEAASVESMFPSKGDEHKQITIDDKHRALEENVDAPSSNSSLGTFVNSLLSLLAGLGPSLEASWSMHPKLLAKVAKVAAHCLFLATYVSQRLLHVVNDNAGSTDNLDGVISDRWQIALENLAKTVYGMQKSHCWQVAAAQMEFLVTLPPSFHIYKAISEICIVLECQCMHAPKLKWRLLAGAWLSKCLLVEISFTDIISSPLLQLLCTMLEHPEPELRLGALQQLGSLLQKGSVVEQHQIVDRKGPSIGISNRSLTFDRVIYKLVTATWDRVVSSASGDPLLALRREALELLLNFIPLAPSHQLQSLLSSIDAICPVLSPSVLTIKTGPLTQRALAVLARACLYCSVDDIGLVPEKVWTNIEHIAKSKHESAFLDAERRICHSLLQLREEEEFGRQAVLEVLEGKHEGRGISHEFTPVRDAVLEVLARMDVFQMGVDSQDATGMLEIKELEEAEIELDVLKEEHATEHPDKQFVQCNSKDAQNTKQHLKKIRDQILAEDRYVLRAEVIARRERQRLARHERQAVLEEATMKEINMLQELDQERAIEAEREIERQRSLEKERAKTRELRHALEMEAEKRAQREYQRELEQRDSGSVRPSRREFGNSGSNRLYQAQVTNFSHGRERVEDRAYEEPGNGTPREAGDTTSNYGDSEGGGYLDGGSSGAHRQGSSRTSRPRQIVERRERDSRREGKWERKQN